jgi:hypothetical protein
MPLQFADFAHYYEGEGMSAAQQHAHFEAFADLIDCIARYYGMSDDNGNELGIRLNENTLALLRNVDSSSPTQFLFNEAASDEAAGKKEA